MTLVLNQLNHTIDWDPVDKLLDKFYHTGKAEEGGKAYPALLLFKCLLLQKWFQIKSDPENVSIGDEPSVHHALAGLVGHHMTVNNADVLMKFLTRLGIDYQVITLRAAIARDPEIMETKAVKSWISTHADELM